MPTISPATAGSASSTGSRSASTPPPRPRTSTTRSRTARSSSSAASSSAASTRPGHRPEHCCLAVVDRSRAEEPWLVLTGDSLFVGDAARPDLAVSAREGAEGLFHSLRRLLELPDGVEVFPGHVAGSLCGKAMSSKASTTIGFERRFNRALPQAELEEFVAASASISAPKPPNVARIVALNRGPFVGVPPEPPELPAPAEDAQLVDVRPVPDFLAGHRTGALNVPVSGSSFATRAGFVLDPERPVTVGAARRGRGPARDPRPPLGRLPRRRRLRPRRRAGADGAGRARRPPGPPRRGAPSCSTSASRTSATRATSPAAATSRTGCSPSAAPTCPRTARS